MENKGKEFKIIAWNIGTPLPQVPERLAMYVVKNGLQYKIYITDARGRYMAQNTVGEGIDDDIVSLIKTWSSHKINQELMFTENIPVILAAGKTAGAYKNEDVVVVEPGGKSIKELIYMLLQEIVLPTYENPTYTLTSNITGTVEVGQSVNVNLTGNYNRGLIKGKITGGKWKPQDTQGPRSGVADFYMFEGVNTGVIPSRSINSYIVTQGNNTFNSSVTHTQGQIPQDSSGNNLNPYPAGTIIDTTSFQGELKRFFGAVQGSENPRSLGSVFNNSSLIFDLNSGTVYNKFRIYLPPGRVLEKVISVEASNADITSQYTYQGTVPVMDAGGNPVTYKLYEMNTDAPYTQNNTHRITIKNG